MNTETPASASYVQRGMWALAQRNRGAPLNIMILPWRIRGPLQIPTLQTALEKVIARHPTLRTQLEYNSGQLLQNVIDAEPFSLIPTSVDGATPEARMENAITKLREEGRQALDLSVRPPVRIRLLQLDETDHVLCIFVHHAMCDGWSSQIIIAELAAFYHAHTHGQTLQLPQLKQQYADFAAWQIQTYESGGFASEINYWRTELADLPPPIELPVVAPRKGNRDWRADSPTHLESLEALAQLKASARQKRVSLFSLMLGGIAVLLHQRTGATDLVIGISTLNRWSKEAMQIVGCFTNLLPARIRITRDMRFDDLVTQVHATMRRLLAYGRIPYELILRELYGSLNLPVFPIWCQFREPAPTTVIEAEKLVLTPFLVDRGGILCDLEVDLIESDRGLQCMFAHRAALFDAGMVAALMEDYSRILDLVAVEQGLLVSDLCERAFRGLAP